MDTEISVAADLPEHTFKHMIEGLLSEIRIPTSLNDDFSAWFSKFKSTLLKLKDAEIDCSKWNQNLPLPKHINIENVGNKFLWKKPSSVTTIGSWFHGTGVQKISSVDLCIEIPKDCLHKSDLLNHKYHIKRALYLAYLAKKLQDSKFDQLCYECPDGNPLKPVLDVRTEKGFVVRLHLVPPADFFNLNRLSPDKNNLRFNHFFDVNELTEIESASEPTPDYNYSIATDILLQSTDNIINTTFSSRPLKEALILLKTWLQQRSLIKGYGALSSTVVSIFVHYLLQKGDIHESMSSLQIFKIVLMQLANSEWDVNGISCSGDEEHLNNWKNRSDVIFLDETGALNLTCQMSKVTYRRIKYEANITLSSLSEPSLQSFTIVFMQKLLFLCNFDHILQVELSEIKTEIESREDMKWKILNHSGNTYPVGRSIISNLVERSFRSRLHLLDVECSVIEAWRINQLPSYEKHRNEFIRIGIIINKELAQKQVEKCDGEDIENVQEFKDFWGEISELRRFRDGSMSESVVFSNNKYRVSYEMLKYILEKHLHQDLNQNLTSYLDNQLESLFEPEFLQLDPDEIVIPTKKPKRKKRQTSEVEPVKVNADEITNEATKAVDKLTKILRQLEGLPLSITSIQGVSPLLRFTNPFPTPPQRFISSDLLLYHNPQVKNCALMKVPGKKGKSGVENLVKVVKLVEPISILVQLELTGKWPDNLEAVERLKCALLINIGQAMKSQFGLTVQSSPQFLDILMDGFIFRIRLFYLRELMLLKEVKDTDGIIKLKDNPLVHELEKEGIHLPKLTSTLHSFKHQFEPFGKVCRLAKRWLASHMMLSPSFNFQIKSDASSTFPEEAVELLVASLFINHRPYLHHPNEAQTGFLRFLELLSNTDWKITPVMVNFNQTLLPEEVQTIERDFQMRREAFPNLFIATPHDKASSIWTKNIPTIILKRTAVLAQLTLKLMYSLLTKRFSTSQELQKSLVSIFSSPLDHFDVIIWLKKSMNSKYYQNIHASPIPRLQFKKYSKCDDEFIPIVSFDPVTLYVQELQESFGHLAMFFYDSCGGTCVTVVWKPDCLKSKDFSVTNVKGRHYNDSIDKLDVNIEGILEAFKVLGDGLVDRIEAKSDNWKV